jgi:hypothetical protein
MTDVSDDELQQARRAHGMDPETRERTNELIRATDLPTGRRPTEPRRKSRLLSREDWKTLMIIWGGAGIISIAGSLVGNVLAGWI